MTPRALTCAMVLLASASCLLARQDQAPTDVSPRERQAEPGRARVACGPSAMSFAAKLLRVPVTNAELGALADESGTSTFADLARFARRKKLYAEAFTMTPAQLARLERVAILQLVVRSESTGAWREHFVTWAGPGQSIATGVVFDPVPMSGRGEVPMKILAAKWTGAALVISEDPIDMAEITGESRLLPSLLRSGAIGACAGSTALVGMLFVRSRRRVHRGGP